MILKKVKTIKTTTIITILSLLLAIGLYSVYNVVDSHNRYTLALNENRIAVTNAINITMKEAQNAAYLQGVIDGKNGTIKKEFKGGTYNFYLPLIKDSLEARINSIK